EVMGRLKQKDGFKKSELQVAAERAKIKASKTGSGQRIEGETPSDTGGTPAPLPYVVTIVTDFEAHALWMDECVDLYCVAAEETKARLLARGARAENMIATGIPIAAEFARKVERRAVRKKLGLRHDQAGLRGWRG